MDDNWERQLEDRAWWDFCRERAIRSFPPGALGARERLMLHRMSARNAELQRTVAEHLADPTKSDPRTWVF